MLLVRPLICLEFDEGYNLRSPLRCSLLHFSLIFSAFYYQVLLNIMFNTNRPSIERHTVLPLFFVPSYSYSQIYY